jgi:transposase-like protein
MAAAALPQSSRDATMQIQSSSRGSTHETNTTTESRRTPDAERSPDMSVRQIAAKLGINSGTVSKWLRQHRAETPLSIEGLIAQTQQNFENLPPSEAEKLSQLRDELRARQQAIIKRQISLLEGLQAEGMTALKRKTYPQPAQRPA